MIGSVGIIGSSSFGSDAPPITVFYAGWPTDAYGNPEEPVGAWSDYGNTADRVYAVRWNATVDGIVTGAAIRWGSQVNVGTHGSWIVVYQNNVKIGQYPIPDPTDYGPNGWEPYQTLNIPSGQNLQFSVGDNLTFGLAFDGAGTPCYTCNNNANTWDPIGNQYKTTTMTSGGPASPLTFSTSANDNMACILRYELR